MSPLLAHSGQSRRRNILSAIGGIADKSGFWAARVCPLLTHIDSEVCVAAVEVRGRNPRLPRTSLAYETSRSCHRAARRATAAALAICWHQALFSGDAGRCRLAANVTVDVIVSIAQDCGVIRLPTSCVSCYH